MLKLMSTKILAQLAYLDYKKLPKIYFFPFEIFRIPLLLDCEFSFNSISLNFKFSFQFVRNDF